MPNIKPAHSDDDGLTKEYVKNKKSMWTDSYLKDCVGIQSRANAFKVNKTEIGAWRSLCRDITADKYIQGLTLF